MGVSIGKKYNEINLIIREEEGRHVFSINEEGKIENLVFDIYTQCFDFNKTFKIKLFFVYSKQENPEVENLSFFKIGSYKVSNNGFKEEEFSNKQLTKESYEEKSGITNGFSADLKLILNNIKLNPGFYEITAMSDDGILGLYPFRVVS